MRVTVFCTVTVGLLLGCAERRDGSVDPGPRVRLDLSSRYGTMIELGDGRATLRSGDQG